MSETKNNNFPFPDGPNDRDVFFHNELAFEYRADLNTWECYRLSKDRVQSPTTTK